MKGVEIKKDRIYIDGEPSKIVSGAMHYFRIHPDYWQDRLLKLKECGCNCVETYVAWNLHEKREGKFDFSGWLDLGSYIDMAKEMGLYVILRPGPYICSEWDMGGLPWWLLKYSEISLRCSAPLYLSKITPYLKKICEIVRPRMQSNGGNIILVQIENEYGDIADDADYMRYIRDLYLAEGISSDLIVSVGASIPALTRAAIDGAFVSVNYRMESEYALKLLKDKYPNQPGMVMELWNGRAQHWGEEFIRRDVNEVAESVDKALLYGDLVNFYMFHGGTTFGFMNGATNYNQYVVQMTSYDVDAPLDEYGRRTPKYYKEQEVICKHLGVEKSNTAKDTVIKSYPDVKYVGAAPLSASHIYSTSSKTPLSMEACDQGHGYIIYDTELEIFATNLSITLPEIHDIAHIYIDGVYAKTVYRDDANRNVPVGHSGKVRLSVLVENMGRVNCGVPSKLIDRKGLIGNVSIGNSEHFGYKMYSAELESLPRKYDSVPTANTPTFYKYTFYADEVSDTVLHPEGFTRGVAFINGFNLGRHWDIENSENKLFIPAPFIHKGENEIVIFDVLANDAEKKIRLSEF